MIDLIDLIQKRHEGPGWKVFTELANGIGTMREHRRADAVAIGLWPSRGQEIHGYECKRSRSDVRKELADVTKADAVGKYCDFWWMVISDASIIDGLLVPSTWGVLTPRNGVLRAIRPAKKRKSAPVDRAFLAACVRSVTNHWVPREEHQRVIDQQHDAITEAVQHERERGSDAEKAQHEALKRNVAVFEKASGLDIAHQWNGGEIGAAVRLLLTLGQGGGEREIERRIVLMKQAATMSRDYATRATEHAQALERLLESHAPRDYAKPEGPPADAHDRQGGPGDRGDPGPPQ